MLLFIDSFDHYTTQAQMFLKWNGLSSNANTSAAGGRRGTGGANLNATSAVIDRILQSPNETVIAGVAFSPGVTPGFATALMFFGDTGLSNTLVQVTIAVDADNAIRAYRGTTIGTLLGTSANNAILPASYQYVEAKVKISATVGTVEVRVNGVAVLTLTGQNTKNTANSTISHMALNGVSSSDNFIDDFYCCNTTAPDNVDFLGDCRVDRSMPTGDGFYGQWTPSTPGTHFNMVNAVPPQIVNNVSDATIGNKDIYNVTDLAPLTGTIFGVQMVHYANKSDAGARSMQALVRSATIDAASSAVALGTGVNFYPAIIERDPNTTALWVEAGFNAAQFGQQTA